MTLTLFLSRLTPLILGIQNSSPSTVLKEKKDPGVFPAQKEKKATRGPKDHQALRWIQLT